MRITPVVAAVILFSVPALAQHPGSTRINVFASNVSFAWAENSGSEVGGGIGVGLSHWFSARWSSELSVSRESFRYQEPPLVVPGQGVVISSRETHGYPIDVLAQYHIPNGSKNWKPYAGMGARYVQRPAGLEGSSSETSAQLNGGVTYHFTERFGVRFDSRLLLRANTPVWDDTFKTAFGLTWRF
jgi:outer membrane protein W